MNRTNGKNVEYGSQPAAPASRGFLAELLTQLRVSIVATILLAIVVCGIYPVIVWGLAQVMFQHQANGSLIGKDGKPAAKIEDAVGSSLIGQNFNDAKYFHPRPSAAGNGYDPTASGGSNLGPTSAKLLNGTTKKDDKGVESVDFDGVHDRIVHYCDDNGIPFQSSAPLATFKDTKGSLDDVKLINAFNADSPLVFTPATGIPADAVTASGSGLDPHISPANAKLQAQRVADARKIKIERVNQMIERFTEGPSLGFLGDAGVNVLRLNLALDARSSVENSGNTGATTKP